MSVDLRKLAEELVDKQEYHVVVGYPRIKLLAADYLRSLDENTRLRTLGQAFLDAVRNGPTWLGETEDAFADALSPQEPSDG